MVTNVDRYTLLSLIEDGATVLDVLPHSEYASGHIPGARNMPLRKLDAVAVADLERSKPVVVY
jgi:rhodanese-related sulfurtransferase